MDIMNENTYRRIEIMMDLIDLWLLSSSEAVCERDIFDVVSDSS